MTLAISGFLFGALIGVFRARRASGNMLDQAQYAIVHAIIFALAGMIIAIIVVRAG